MKTARIITSVLVMSVVLACSFVPVVSANAVLPEVSDRDQFFIYFNNDPDVYCQIDVLVFNYQYEEGDFPNGSTVSQYEKIYPVLFTFTLKNNGDQDAKLSSSYLDFVLKFEAGNSSRPDIIDYTPVDDSVFSFTNVAGLTSTYLVFNYNANVLATSDRRIIVPAGSSVAGSVMYYVSDRTQSGMFSVPSCTINRTITVDEWGDFYEPRTAVNIYNIYDILENWYAAYTVNDPLAQDVIDQSDDIMADEQTIHNQEEQWYQQNLQAIESTGLSNYQFSTSQISGLTAITTQFSQIWDVLGDWNLVYIFTLLLSFATYILRHRPSTKSQQRVAASEEYRYSNFMHNLAWRNEIRARWKAQDARYDKGDSSGASDLMRRNIRR